MNYSNSKQSFSVKISILLNFLAMVIFIGFIYSAYQLSSMNIKIQDESFYSRFSSRLYFKCISNLKSSKQSAVHAIYEKSEAHLNDSEELLLSAISEYRILIPEIEKHIINKSIDNHEEKLQSLISEFDILILEKNKTKQKALINIYISNLDKIVQLLYNDESFIWQSEALLFTQHSLLKSKNNYNFYLLTFLFSFFQIVLIGFTFLRYKLVNQIQNQNEQLIVQARMSTLGVMSAELAHEINSPLMVIDGRLKQISNELKNLSFDKEKIVKNFETIQRNSTRIQNIVKNFKLMSKNGKLDSVELIKPPELIIELTEIIKPRAENYHIMINFVEQNTISSIKSIRVQVIQILINLLNNSVDAIKFKDEKWIQIETKDDESNVYFIITDSGLGIDKLAAKKLFEPFFTTKLSDEGTGLGLSLSKKLAQELGGDLTYNSASKNTQFVLQLKRI